MTFKQFYLVKERTYFVDLNTIIDQTITELQNKIAKKKSFNSGDKITVPFGEYEKLDFKFYKGYSRAAREAVKNLLGDADRSDIKGMYFPKDEENNARIEVYVNTAKSSNGYYKERTFEDFMNKSLPKYIKDLLAHEITHAYEDLLMGYLAFDQETDLSNEDEYEKNNKYFNSRTEMNAHLMQSINTEVRTNAKVKYFLLQAHNAENDVQKNQEIANATRTILAKIAQEDWVSYLTKEKKKWIIKTVYTSVAELVDKARIKA